ncbi:MAG TPA: DMT family transporter [Candidatus Limnocylindria bacterium]|nr:DMT family transporter [Candidatus Limnocylindria bacterium]
MQTAASPAAGIGLRETLRDRPVLAAVLGALSIAFSGVLVRLSDAPPATVAFFRCAYALPFLLALAWLERRAFGPRPASQVALAWAAGVFFAIDLELFHHTIGLVGAGLATVLGNTQVVFVALLAWLLLGERMATRTALAVPVVLAGVVLISGVVGAGAYGRDPSLGVAIGLATGLSYAGFLLVLRLGNADLRRPAGPLLDATLSAALVSLLIGLPLGELDLVPRWPSHGWLVALAVSSQVLGWLLISISLPRLPAALTSVVLTLQPVGAVMLGMLLLAEAPSPVQLLGAATIVAGLVLATVRRRADRADRAAGERVA